MSHENSELIRQNMSRVKRNVRGMGKNNLIFLLTDTYINSVFLPIRSGSKIDVMSDVYCYILETWRDEKFSNKEMSLKFNGLGLESKFDNKKKYCCERGTLT